MTATTATAPPLPRAAPAAPPWPAQSLDQPLPAELTGRGHHWFTRYRTWPVYSPGWVRGRWRLWGTALALFAGLLMLAVVSSPVPDRPWGALLHMAIQLLVPLAVGPLAAAWVRRQGWAPAREWPALVAVMAGLVLAMTAFSHFGAEPVKQWLAERTGHVGADGKRKRLMLAVGVSVTTPDPPAAAGPAPGAQPAPAAVPASAAAAAPAAGGPAEQPAPLNLAIWGLITFWMGGGSGLLAWRREQAGLAALHHERELQRAQAQRREAELKLSVLAAQVEPHFLFNTLAGVRSAIASDPARASEMVDRLADYLRAAIPRLRSDGSAQATLGGQLDIVRAYLGLMAARMPRLQVSVPAADALPPGLAAAPCPPLMLISLAENAVKHGVEPKVGPARVEVSACRTDDGGLAITVADDGVGFGTATTGSGLGLANIRERLVQLYQGRAMLALKARPEGGVAAILTLPPD